MTQRYKERLNQFVIMRTKSRKHLPLDRQGAADDGDLLLCPKCNGSYTHVTKAYGVEGSDPYEKHSGTIQPIEAVGGWRRGAVAVRVWCEECHSDFDVIFQQHKGQTFVWVEELESVAL